MAESLGPIASAVVIPEPAPAKSPTTSNAKRRQSSEPESSVKRPRLSEEPTAESPSTLDASPTAIKKDDGTPPEPPKNPGPDRRKSSIQEERKRGQRLFGGLLSTLSQSTPNGQQKRRLEIEKRQKEKAKQQKAEDEGRRARKLAQLNAIRKDEQIKFNEESMRIQHSSRLAMAQFLCTKTEPKLYYMPWELLPEQKALIKSQIAEAEEAIRKELDDFESQHPERIRQTSTDEKTNNTSKETVGEPQVESLSVSKISDSTNDTPVQVTQPDQVASEKQALEEHNGEVVVENEEDTVIY
ncbi:pinin/SDK/memA/ protein conserved region-domain-containing protein [Tricladium varicosporioides]|nr:pinin/SDK/memA/ protein conserved region-domain-containing protein [Hymenoscyphus varicosporioides]